MNGVSVSELGQQAFTSGLTTGQLEQVAALAVTIDIPAGCRLFDEGGKAAQLWLVRSGRIALDLRVPGRERIIVETLGPGDELGLSWLTPAAQWQFGAIAQLPVSAFELSSGALIDLCEADHELGYQLTRRLLVTAIARLQAARIRILDLYAAPTPAAGGTP